MGQNRVQLANHSYHDGRAHHPVEQHLQSFLDEVFPLFQNRLGDSEGVVQPVHALLTQAYVHPLDQGLNELTRQREERGAVQRLLRTKVWGRRERSLGTGDGVRGNGVRGDGVRGVRGERTGRDRKGREGKGR